jgi:hypothetical protein
MGDFTLLSRRYNKAFLKVALSATTPPPDFDTDDCEKLTALTIIAASTTQSYHFGYYFLA